MNTISDEEGAGRQRRRKHSAEFKSRVVTACSRPGVSIAAVAMANGVNANLARRWVVDAERHGDSQLATSCQSGIVPRSFVPLQLPPAGPAAEDIRIELHRGTTVVNVRWPSGAAAECAAWMRELLR